MVGMMRRALLTAMLTGGMVATTATAQSGMSSRVVEVEPPAPSETPVAEPDWYRQFTLKSDADLSRDAGLQLAPEKGLSLDFSNVRGWQFRVDLRTRDNQSPLPREEMSAGATFRITPRLSIGGDLSVGAHELDDASQWDDQQLEAGIRLRSAFKF